jgi:hypothetical protein
MNSFVEKLFEKRKGDDGHGMVVKGNDSGRWSSYGVVLWLWRRQNRDAVEWWREWTMFR